MAKTRKEKEVALASLQDKVDQAKSMVFVNFDKLKVKEIEALRKKCRAEKIDYVVAKKTLMKLAFKHKGIDVDVEAFDKSIATVLGYNDEVAPARVISDFAKDHEALYAIGGVLENKFIDRNYVLALAKLPSREQLLASVVGSLKSPVSGFVNVLSGTLRGFVYALNAVKEAKSN